MNTINSITVSVLLLFLPSVAAGQTWLTDLGEGLAKAQATGKPLLVKFTGSDWCEACIEIRKQVLSKAQFINRASQDYILVLIDQPMRDAQTSRRNAPLFKKYQVHSVPRIVLMTPQGQPYHSFSPTGSASIDGVLASVDPSKLSQ